ncbi:MAG: hypothetical protein WCA31_05565 [Acidimicrobiales bacterium]
MSQSESSLIVLETDDVRVELLARRGGKITSLFDTSRGREWLVQAERELAGAPDTTVPYDEGDLCGWDEMMPTIEACRLPGTDRVLPDHGELWRTPWEVSGRTASSVTTVVRSDLGYRFERTLTLDANVLTVDYCVVGTGAGPVEYLWAAHPFVVLAPDTRLYLDGAHDVTEAGDDGTQRIEWPVDGFRVAKNVEEGSGRKLFARATEDSVGVSLVDEDGARLTWRWSASDAPWLGLWLDHASLSRHLVAAIEPTTSGEDSLEVSSLRGQSMTIAPEEVRQWRISVEVGEGRPDKEEVSWAS